MFKTNKTYKISYRKICNTHCKEPCKSCIVETNGTFTGREFDSKFPDKKLYEFSFIKNGKKEHSIFLEEDILKS